MSDFNGWKILHIHLNEGIYPLSLYPNYEGLYVVFWWYNIPLGDSKILATELPMSAIQVQNLAARRIIPAVSTYISQSGISSYRKEDVLEFSVLTNLEKPLRRIYQLQPKPTEYSISIIVPTCNRPERLATCLQSLQNLSQRPHEILVVDNYPSLDATRQLLEQMPDMRYIAEPQPGASIARNTGVEYATGDIVAFIDDDMTAHPDWLTKIQQNFAEPEVMAVTGLVLPGELATEAQLMFEEYWSFNKGFSRLNYDSEFIAKTKKHGIPVWVMGGSGNMAIRRQTFKLLGGFDTRLGAGPKAAGCSEDSELFYRLVSEGLLCRYEPTAVAYHFHRSDINSFKKQAFGYMRGHVAALLIQFEKYHHWGNIRRLLTTLPKFYTKLWLKGLLKGFQPRHTTLYAELAGCFSGVSFYFKNKLSPHNLGQ
ncbi:family 2 glycosyl transferase [Calothrix sp. NIES-4071]|nr:family 2 glycosyl transferase [Calothrix sp. NIES-4071]BAZ57858.1 family 2 glycosyl transferase [Calothrix sp. NIES-4105]